MVLNPSMPVALESLLKRRSHHQLKAPAPSREEWALIVQAGMRAPDFLQLRPYRLLCAQGEGRQRLGEAMGRAAVAAGQPSTVIQRCRQMPLRAPLVVTVVACLRDHALVSPLDQTLCAGSVVLMMQLAAQALGYGSVWRSGWLMADRGFHHELGLAEQEHIVGFLYMGTPTQADSPAPTAVATQDIVEWL